MENFQLNNMEYFFLIANSETSNSIDTVEKIKKLNFQDNYHFIFFNRFLRDLKNNFWIDFIKSNKISKLWFVSRMTQIQENKYPNKKSSALWGLYGEECICSSKHKLDKYFEKIFIFANNRSAKIFYHNCPNIFFKKSVHVNDYKQINNTNFKNPSSGLLMYLFIKKYYPKSITYLIGFEHTGLKDHEFELEKKYFESQKLHSFNLQIDD